MKKNSFWKNYVTYGTPCRAIGHFVFLLPPCYLQDAMPCQWSSSGFPVSATDLTEHFLLSGVFYLALLPASFKESLDLAV